MCENKYFIYYDIYDIKDKEHTLKLIKKMPKW